MWQQFDRLVLVVMVRYCCVYVMMELFGVGIRLCDVIAISKFYIKVFLYIEDGIKVCLVLIHNGLST